jgi:hypothetical protein
MPDVNPARVRARAFRAVMAVRLGPRLGPDARWKPRTQLPTLEGMSIVERYSVGLGVDIAAWLYVDSGETALEACQANWRPAIRQLASDPMRVPTVQESLAAFNRHVRPMERAQRTRGKYLTHRLSVLTWAIWKGTLPDLLPMSDDMLRAFLWDALAFETSLSVLRHAVNAILAWHQRLRLPPPLGGRGDYRRLLHSLSRFQGTPRRLIFPIYAGAVRRLLRYRRPEHGRCSGAGGGCSVCKAFLHRWRDCQAGALATIICSRCAEVADLQTCDLWKRFDEAAGYRKFRGGAAINVKVRKNDQFRQGHQPRVGTPESPEHDIIASLQDLWAEIGIGVHSGCAKRRFPAQRCPVCPPMFPKSSGDGFNTSRAPTSSEVSRMIVRGLSHVGFDTSLFSGISARKGGLSTAIEAGVPEHILWMQSGHAQDVAARRYVQLRSPTRLYETWAAFRL